MYAILQYMKEMALGMLAGLPFVAGVRLLLAVLRKGKVRTTLLHELLTIFLGCWILNLMSQTVLPELAAGIQNGFPSGPGRVNLIPFTVFRQTAVEVFRNGNTGYFFINFLGNILIFLPLGLLPPLLWKKMERFWKAAVLGCGISVAIELTQLLLPRGTDIDDVWLNTLGAALGYGMFALIRWIFPQCISRCRMAPAAERISHG